MEEIWKTVVVNGEIYESYEVSNLGRVRSLRDSHGNYREKILSLCKERGNYLRVILHKKGKIKNCKIHRLVAEAFIPNTENLPQVNHKDENKENNCVWNLEWCDRKYNCNYGTRNKRLSKSRGKAVICIETGEIFPSTYAVERELGIRKSSISECCNGNRKTAKKLHWKYLE